MIKKTIEQLLFKLNSLDPGSDTLIKIDYRNHSVIAAQNSSQVLMIPEFLVLCKDIKKITYLVVLKKDLDRIKNSLIYCLNHSDKLSVVPGNKIATLMIWDELMVKSGIVLKWFIYDKIRVRTNKLVLLLLSLTSITFREIYSHLKSIKVS